MPKIRLKNSRFHKQDVTIKVSRQATGRTIQQKGSDGAWYTEPIERLTATCNYQGQVEQISDDLFYNRWGHVTGWHPMVGAEFFVPYLSKIRDAGFGMHDGETKTIKVSRR